MTDRHERPDAAFELFLEDSAPQPVYVVLGVQGSGTNLLTQVMTRVFGFSVLLDRSMVFKQAARLGSDPTRDQVSRAISTVLSRLFPSALTRKTRKDAIRDNALFHGIAGHLTTDRIKSGEQLARMVYAFRAFSQGTVRMAIKSDDLWEDMSSLDQVLPNRRIILLTRDFRDNLLSISGKDFGPIEPLCAARYVKNQFAHYHREYERAGDQGLHIRFEDLVERPLHAVERFGTHFGLAPAVDPATALDRFHMRKTKVRKWKRMLAPATLAHCEALLQGELTKYGYGPIAVPRPLPSQGTMLLAGAKDTFRRVPQKVTKTLKRLQR